MLLSILLTEYSVMFPAEQLFFLFIALRLMQNGSSEPFCIKRKGFFLFLFFSLKRESAGVLLYKVFSFR